MRPILPGRPHSGRQAISTAYWNGNRLIAYLSHSAIVVTTGLYSILQTIYLDCEPLQAVAIEEFSGRIAASNSTTVFVFEPVGQGKLKWEPLGPRQGVLTSSIRATNGDTNGDRPRVNGVRSDPALRRASIPTIDTVTSISWASAEELLVGGSRLQLWYISYDSRVVWDQELPYPVAVAYCSQDAGLIASCGQHDRLVKIWRRLSYESDSTRFDVSYLSHPSAVTNLHWRKPWHQEQSLDSLLYTFCADGYVRAWAHTDPHSISIMQKVAAIDTAATIQPRRLSVGSISPRRYAFIIDSRDFSHATERAVENAPNTKSDHALEHLIAIANRSPEICIVLDGLGHMSAWGLENAGCKNKLATEVFNVAHVDDVDLSLLQKAHLDTEHVQFCAFAGGSAPSSISLLVHSFGGSISHYEAHIASLFDTATRRDRLQQSTAWAGHEAPVEDIIHNEAGDQMLTWTERDVKIFSVDDSDDSHLLEVQVSRSFDDDIIDVLLIQLDSGDSPQKGHFAIDFTDSTVQVWLPQSASRAKDSSQPFLPAPVDEQGHNYLRALYSTRADPQSPLSWRATLAASHSTSQDILTTLTLTHTSSPGTLLPWPTARHTRLPLWLSPNDPPALINIFTLLARTAYTSQPAHPPRSPVPCSLYYLALRQKPLLLSLWRTAHGVSMRDVTLKLLARDFSEPRWKEAALKNAYALLSKRRFEYAAAWFLLAGRLRDAVVGVCVSKMGDWVLGVSVARVWMVAGEGEIVGDENSNSGISNKGAKREGAKVIREVLSTTVKDEITKLRDTAGTDNTAEAAALEQWSDELLASLGPADQENDNLDARSDAKEDDSATRKGRLPTRTAEHLLSAPRRDESTATNNSTTTIEHKSILDAFAKEEPSEAEKKLADDREKDAEVDEKKNEKEKEEKKPAPTQFQEPSADSLLDSFGF
ncbi:Regulator of V-ATPase in vacuolar membrane protein 1 [Cyphellophora attinorum]|uniref:Regulator of V-ATPase in vacuolar membrane protein 1 n=1 Tax=Cyphellophora attinorum TaxID=1664694 RepID=A0A0N1H9Y2_9EURO|nr:Regulator of V-ATPase in vacuolar membrane protein 1 [Phialophora attinorum]KPI40482.1 Regulator of V-ATPase in vacuolar membrane protein 1 [Phialophora attinorum]